MPYLDYTDQDIIDKAKIVYSMAALLRALGLIPAGGNYVNMQRNLQRLKIDTSHWLGQSWNTGQQLKPLENYTRAVNLKKHLIYKRGHRCEKCFFSEWQGQPIMLELEHEDGDRGNNEKTNLKLLCPNCHAQTSTWRRRK